jgi:hypothetical protein
VKDIKLSIISYRLLYLSQNNNCQFAWLNYVESILNECGLVLLNNPSVIFLAVVKVVDFGGESQVEKPMFSLYLNPTLFPGLKPT